MKRMMACLCAMVMLFAVTAMPTTASGAQSVGVSDYVYARIEAGGVDGTMVYTAYEADGSYVTGAMTAQGEQSRVPFTAEAYDALFDETVLVKTVLGDAGALCPYADTHGEDTVCPYLDVKYVAVTNTVTDATLEGEYIESSARKTVGDTVHFCWGRDSFTSPVTMKWNGKSRYIALKNDDGLWGAYDAYAGKMVTAYAYAAMSAFDGSYAKVSDGTAWGRLDVSGIYPTMLGYTDEAAFSVAEELRVLADGTYQVFDPDNNAISVVFDGAWDEVSYDAAAHLVRATMADGTTVLYDLQGDEAGRFAATDVLTPLQSNCYKAERFTDNAFVGAALVRVDGAYDPYAAYVKGDINTSGSADSYDVRLALRAITEMIELSDKQEAIADMNGDGRVNTVDARAQVQAILND